MNKALQTGIVMLSLSLTGSAGAQELSTRRPGAPLLPQGRRATIVEGEALLPGAQASQGRAVSQRMGSFGNAWSGGAQLFWAPRRSGARLSLTITVPAAGTYSIAGQFTKAPDYGVFQVGANGRQAGQFDGFNLGRVVHSGSVALGEVPMNAGANQIIFLVIGKNPGATGFMVGIDRIELTPAGAAPADQGQPPGPAGSQLTLSGGARQPIIAYKEGALLYVLSGDQPVTTEQIVSPQAENRSISFIWDLAKIPSAGGVLWQVSRVGFAPFAGGAESDLAPHGLVDSDRGGGTLNSVALHFGRLAIKAGVERPGRLRLPKKSGKKYKRNPTASFFQAGGKVSFFVRVIPIVSVDDPTIVGRPSNAIRVVYGGRPPVPQPPYVEPDTHPSKLRITRFEFHKYNTYRHPRGCKFPKGGNKRWWDSVGDFVSDSWNWATKTYANAKKKVVSVVAKAVPVVPESVLEIALDGALMAAGIPPSIPNMDELMEGGADYLAAQVVEEVGPPLASDLAREKLKKAILAGAKEARKAARGSKKGACETRTDPPYLLVTLQNDDHMDYERIDISAYNPGGVFRFTERKIAGLDKGQRLTVPFVLYPDLRDEFWDGQLFSWAKYWQVFHNRKVHLTIRAKVRGHRDWTPPDVVFETPDRVWNESVSYDP